MAGCACQSQYYLDTSVADKSVCVAQSNCPCFDSESNTYIKANGNVSRSCGNWYEDVCLVF